MDGRDMKAKAMADHQSNSLMAQEETAPAKSGDMKTDSVTFRPAENGGVIANVSRSPIKPPKDGGMGPMLMYQSKDYVFGSIDAAAEFLRSEFGGGSATEDGEAMDSQ